MKSRNELDFISKKDNRGFLIFELSDEEKKEIELVTKARIDKHGVLFNKISEALFRHDPIGLNFDTNIDEYDYETELIMSKLDRTESNDEITEIVYQVFVETFDIETVKNKEQFRAIAQDIRLLYKSDTTELGS